MIKAIEAAAMTVGRGILRIQAQTICLATPHRTAERQLVAPTPERVPVIVCVVLTGMPAMVALIRITAPAVSAQKPPTGLSFVGRIPIVFWASLAPCPRLCSAAEASCNRLNKRSIRLGGSARRSR